MVSAPVVHDVLAAAILLRNVPATAERRPTRIRIVLVVAVVAVVSRVRVVGKSLRVDVAALGNAAGRGARLALLCGEARERARALAERITYVELANNPVWRTLFAEAMRFPE